MLNLDQRLLYSYKVGQLSNLGHNDLFIAHNTFTKYTHI